MENDKMRILIVDDERSNLEVLSRILKSGKSQSSSEKVESPHSDYTLIVAKSGEAALKKVEEERPDLILLGVIMPGMDGFKVLSKLKSSDSTRGIPVIFITGLDSVEDEEKGFFLGAVDYITKPFHSSLVKARVEPHLRIVEQMRTIEMLGLIDSLTGIANRRGFDNQMTTEWGRSIREKTPLSLLMLDIAYFKRFNDIYGHQQGDIVIKTVAKILKRNLNRQTDFAARWGGEEFAILLPNTELNGAMTIAEKIRTNIENTVITSITDISALNITVSVGVASSKPDIASPMEDFIGQGDKALYAAKEAGRNRVSGYKMEG